MAGTTNDGLAIRIGAPAIGAGQVHVIVGVFRLDEVQITNHTAVYDLLGLHEAGSKAADLTHHEEFAGFIGGLYHFFTIFKE